VATSSPHVGEKHLGRRIEIHSASCDGHMWQS